MKSTIYNLIILDESGSMNCVWDQTISGCNETINTIRNAQEKFADTQEHLVSIYAFQDGGMASRYLVKNVPALTVDHISHRDYIPSGLTPLYDAIGATLADLKAVVAGQDLAIGNVTIITDGEENSSKEYTEQKVTKMIDQLKELGWSFNFIGANIDVKHVGCTLHIENTLSFTQTVEGTQEMFEHERNSRMKWCTRAHNVVGKFNSRVTEGGVLSADDSEAMRADLNEASKDYFDA